MKRFALKLVLFLLLGAIVNVSVAWGLGLLIHSTITKNDLTNGYTARGPGYQGWFVERATQFQSTMVVSDWENPQVKYRGFYGKLPTRSAESLIPGWAPQLAPSSESPQVSTFAESWEYGWPARSMGGLIVWRDMVDTNGRDMTPVQVHVEFCCAVVRDPALFQDPNTHMNVRPIVLKPLWPGFAVNTVFYAAILWLPFAALGVFRRRRRTKRGLCPKCAYDLQGRSNDSTACPECGRSAPTICERT